MALRFLLTDDNRRFAESARALLEREAIEVVGIASSIAETLRLVDELRPDVVLVDIDLGPESGFNLALELAALPCEMDVVLISAYPQDEFSELIAASPAVGFVPKSELSARAVAAVLADRDVGSNPPA